MTGRAVCDVCFRRCELRGGQMGFCGARIGAGDAVKAENYGKITSLALDPIEKKPLRRFHPGSRILSAGSYGCNLRCPFCQNHAISWPESSVRSRASAEYLSPEALADMALSCRDRGNIGLAFTYNEPLVGWEYVRDASALARKAGLKNVLVTNGTASEAVLGRLPDIDAMNVDIKSFSPETYRDVLGGDLEMVKAFIARAAERCHVEITFLAVPGLNDSEEEMEALAGWVSSLPCGTEIPLHVSRFFPRFHMTDCGPTEVSAVYRLADIARKTLRYVYTGNC